MEKEYTEHDMKLFALEFATLLGRAIRSATDIPIVDAEFEKWKRETVRF